MHVYSTEIENCLYQEDMLKLHAKVCHVILGTWTTLDFGIHWGLKSNPAVIQSNGCTKVNPFHLPYTVPYQWLDEWVRFCSDLYLLTFARSDIQVFRKLPSTNVRAVLTTEKNSSALKHTNSVAKWYFSKLGVYIIRLTLARYFNFSWERFKHQYSLHHRFRNWPPEDTLVMWSHSHHVGSNASLWRMVHGYWGKWDWCSDVLTPKHVQTSFRLESLKGLFSRFL